MTEIIKNATTDKLAKLDKLRNERKDLINKYNALVIQLSNIEVLIAKKNDEIDNLKEQQDEINSCI